MREQFSKTFTQQVRFSLKSCIPKLFREGAPRKTFTFGHCPNYLYPPVRSSGRVVLLFGRQKQHLITESSSHDDENDQRTYKYRDLKVEIFHLYGNITENSGMGNAQK